ncbi:MAG: AlpA family phage regulatory protein [Rhizobiales bacterium]|jgi:prophage regulatory protein|nr:AlpA family phage regulatory protein [Hyphomicrobiales bacterium]
MSKPDDDLSASVLFELNAFMSEKAVLKATSLSRASIHRKRLAGQFPEPEQITEGRVGYRFRDVQEWLADPIGWAMRRNSPDI